MNRATRELIKQQRQKSGFIGFKTGGKAGTTRGGLFSNLFKRKKMQPPTPSGVTKKKTTTTKPSATKDTPKPAGQTNRSGGNRAGGAGSNKQGRAEQMNKNAAGNRQSNTKSTTTKGSTNRAVTGKPNTAGVKSTSKATDAEVKAWKARKPSSMKPESWKGYRNVGAAINAWRKEDPRKK